MLKVIIFLCTYQGKYFLGKQLDSIVAQSYTHWKIIASDDGSTDDTLKILKNYQNILGENRLEIIDGPRKGFATNFLSLISREYLNSNCYYAYADQDDLWKQDKLQRSVDWMSTIASEIPALYCSRTELIDQNDCPIGYSPLFNKPPSFANAIVQSLAGGNTMLFNFAAASLLKEFGKDINVITHDWWTYMVVSGCGGKIYYDSIPSIYYRQHTANLVGANSNFFAKIKRIRMLFAGDFKNMNHNNLRNLQKIYAKLTYKNQKIFTLFSDARNNSFLSRLVGMRKSGIYRQTLLGNLGLITGILFNKV